MAARMNVTATVNVERPPAEVFAYLTDVSKHGEWSPKTFRVDGAPDGPVKAGDSFTTYGVVPGDKNHRNEVTVAECAVPTRLVLDATDRGEHFISTFDLQTTGSGTSVTRTLDMPKPALPLSLLMPLIASVFIRPDVRKGLGMLKANLESRRPA